MIFPYIYIFISWTLQHIQYIYIYITHTHTLYLFTPHPLPVFTWTVSTFVTEKRPKRQGAPSKARRRANPCACSAPPKLGPDIWVGGVAMCFFWKHWNILWDVAFFWLEGDVFFSSFFYTRGVRKKKITPDGKLRFFTQRAASFCWFPAKKVSSSLIFRTSIRSLPYILATGSSAPKNREPEDQGF